VEEVKADGVSSSMNSMSTWILPLWSLVDHVYDVVALHHVVVVNVAEDLDLGADLAAHEERERERGRLFFFFGRERSFWEEGRSQERVKKKKHKKRNGLINYFVIYGKKLFFSFLFFFIF
jgi:hypothetical protein